MEAKLKKLKALLIYSQNDLLRMSENAKLQKQSELLVNNLYNAGFHGGNVQAFEYACKHITSILEFIDNNETVSDVSMVQCDLCNHKWVAVRPQGLKELECPNCNNVTTFENIEV